MIMKDPPRRANGLAPKAVIGTVSVLRFNGRPIEYGHDISTLDGVVTSGDGTFVATLKRRGSLDCFDFPDGKYEFEFLGSFAAQSVEVARKVGVKLNDQGRFESWEPRALPAPSDLPAETSFIGEKIRNLKAIRIMNIGPTDRSTKASNATCLIKTTPLLLRVSGEFPN